MAKVKRSGGEGFGKSPKPPFIDDSSRIIAKLVEPLIVHTKDRFPVICHAAPFTEADGETNYAHLMFTVPLDTDESTKHHKLYILERETTPLTK